METGTELSKTVATFIVQKILLDDLGLNYICQTVERFYAVSSVLNNMVKVEAEAATTPNKCVFGLCRCLSARTG